MDRDEVIRLAGQAGFPDCKPENHPFVASGDMRAAHEEFLANLERFAHLVAQREREAEREQCAKLCDEIEEATSGD